MHRFLVLASLWLLGTASASAQILESEEPIQTAFQQLQEYQTLYLQLNATQTTNRHQDTFQYSCYFEYDNTLSVKQSALLELVVYKNDVPIRRIVGDGLTLWNYDYVNNRYSTTVYGSYGTEQPAGYLDNLLRLASSYTDTFSNKELLLLRQTYGSNGANYQSWMPGIQPDSNLTYRFGNPVTKTLTFTVAAGTLAEIDYTDVSRTNNVNRSNSWTMTLVPGTVFDPKNFVFIPPARAMAVTSTGH